MRALSSFLLLPVSIFFIGYVGAERIWFARLFGGESMDAKNVWGWAWHLFPRYMLLSLMTLVVTIPVAIPIVVHAIQVTTEVTQDVREEILRETGGKPDPVRESQLIQQRIRERFGVGGNPTKSASILLTPTLIVLSILSSLFIDVMLTFTTPALAFSTSKPWDALKRGLRLMRETFPQSFLYVAIPPLAALMTLRLLPAFFSLTVYVLLSILGALLNLWFKGATVAFYLRHQPVEVV
jgi:hypothetical protein